MDTRTGELITEEEMQRRTKELERLLSDFVPVQRLDMTPKQKATSKVSKHDNKSKLGKKFVAARYQRNYFFNRKQDV